MARKNNSKIIAREIEGEILDFMRCVYVEEYNGKVVMGMFDWEEYERELEECENEVKRYMKEYGLSRKEAVEELSLYY